MRLAPATLTVGDFVLSNVHCVERKSISDLFGSFNSGRLQDQARAMCKYYKCPILLIEFDPEKTFGLQNASDIGGEVRKDSIISKLSMLTMEFPTLRILWSKSPHETLKIFKKLKRNHQEVDVEIALPHFVDNYHEVSTGKGEVKWEDFKNYYMKRRKTNDDC